MKKLIFIVVAMVIMATSCKNTGTQVQLRIESDENYSEAALLLKDSLYRQPLDAANITVFTLPEKFEPALGAVFFGDKHVLIYMEPGKNTDITVQINGNTVIPVFSGKYARENSYLNEKQAAFSPDYKLNEADFATSLERQLKKSYQTLDAKDFNGSFNRLEKKRIKYTLYNALLEYRSEHLYAIENYRYELNDIYFNALADIFTEDEDILNMSVYQDYMKRMVSYITIHNMPKFENFRYIQEELNYVITRFKNPKVTEFIVDAIISEYIERNGVDKLEELEPIYRTKVTDSKKKAAFEELCNKWKRITAGQLSPIFAYKDINGKTVHLSDFRGKYVYIDCWATWCGPCRREQPFLEKLEKKYANKNICFVSISCDQDKAVWEKVVREEKLKGIHLIADEDDTFMSAYMVSAIPHFILIDPEGKIVNNNMSRPSDPKTVEAFDKLKGIGG
ncbi:MAG: TlpA family protein disulfide reductase [Odoribacter sp.]|nr:TlpA family protein disulfide reductase [Odoribacter sp.]